MEVIKKKRGRKPKIRIDDDSNDNNHDNNNTNESKNTNDAIDIDTIDDSSSSSKVVVESKVHKKRGRKPKNFKMLDAVLYKPSDIVEFEYKKKGRKQKNSIIDKNTIKDKIVFNDKFDDKNENIVLHLPINIDKINNNEFNNNDIHNTINTTHTIINNTTIEPKPYDPNINNMSISTPYILDTNFNEDTYIDLDKKKKREIMVQFSECNKRNEWASTTSIHCFWCAHPFNNIPCTLPHRKINNTYHVFGNFCSPECAASYNFDKYDDNSIERYSLLNGLYRKIYNNNEYVVQLAPPQMALRIFGGTLTIEQFRSYNKNNNKILMINIPPLVSIIPEIEETSSEVNVNNKANYIPLDSDRIKKYNEKLKLQRNKPISDKKNTLESCMNLKYV
jgi:hypothetical protein